MSNHQNSGARDAWTHRLRAEHGELVSGVPLRKLLGFQDAAAFGKAAQEGRCPVPLFKVEGRRAWFALPQDLAEWLAGIGATAPD